MIFENLINLNILQEPQVLSALITSIIGAIASGIAGFFAWLTARNNRSIRQNLRMEHLQLLYEPLDCLLSFQSFESPISQLQEISNLVAAQYRYATPQLTEQISLLTQQDILEFSHFAELQKMVCSLYNWHRKKLGYSYNKTTINKNYIPKTFRRFNATFDALTLFFLLLSLSLLLFALGYVLMQLGFVLHELTLFVSAICVLLILLGIMFRR